MARKKKSQDDTAVLDIEEGGGGRRGRSESSGVRLSAHPRARRHIARAKGWSGMACFVLVAVLSYRSGLPTEDALLRALLAGVGGMLVGWAVVITVWRYVALAQIEDLRRTLIEEMHEREEQRKEKLAKLEAEREALEQADMARQRAPEGALTGP